MKVSARNCITKLALKVAGFDCTHIDGQPHLFRTFLALSKRSNQDYSQISAYKPFSFNEEILETAVWHFENIRQCLPDEGSQLASCMFGRRKVPSVLSIEIGECSSGDTLKNNLLDETTSYWETSGHKPHWFVIELPAGATWSSIDLFCQAYPNYYTAEKCTLNINGCSVVVDKDIKYNGWTTLISRPGREIQGLESEDSIKIELSNASGGTDIRVRGVRVLGFERSLSFSQHVVQNEEVAKRKIVEYLEKGFNDFVKRYWSDDLGVSKEMVDSMFNENEGPNIGALREVFATKMDACHLHLEKMESLLELKKRSSEENRCASIVLNHMHSSLLTALNVLKVVSEMDNGDVLLSRPEGKVIIQGLVELIRLVEKIPPQLLSSIFKQIRQLFLLAGKYKSQRLCEDEIRELGEEILWLAKHSTLGRAKGKIRPVEIEVYNDLVEAAVIGCSILGIDWKSSFCSLSILNVDASAFETADSFDALIALSALVSQLDEVSLLSIETRTIDEELIKFIENEKSETLNSVEELEKMKWTVLVGTATTASIVAYPRLVSAASESAIGEVKIEDASEPELNETERHDMYTLVEMFPDYTFAALFPFYEKTKDVAKAARDILENFDPETDMSKSTGIPLASSSVLGSRFDFIKTLNLTFCRVFDLINFRNTDDGKFI